MSFVYRYTGDLPTVFVTLRDSHGTWTPSKGDTYKSPVEIQHPLLELVVRESKSKKEIVVADITENDDETEST